MLSSHEYIFKDLVATPNELKLFYNANESHSQILRVARTICAIKLDCDMKIR